MSITMFDDPGLWIVLGSMASTAGLLGLWLDRGDDAADDSWPASKLD